MRWFGFGFNAFGQICAQDESVEQGSVDTVKVVHPSELRCRADSSSCRLKTCRVSASWSRRASLHVDGGSSVCASGSRSRAESRGCTDASISESHLTLIFQDRVESWNLQNEGAAPAWSMDIKPEGLGDVTLPLVPGGYVVSKPPFYRALSPHLKARSLALGAEHALLLSASGAVYTWGLGSHGQLGHSGLLSEEEPRAVEALWGMPMSRVAAGGWHSVCVSNGGDLYVWGWNQSGQLGLPSRCLRKESPQRRSQNAGALCPHAATSSHVELQEVEKHEVFISIQAFPALLDVTPPCEIRAVGCGSRHTAAVTIKGDLYTWGWGEYGQLGHQSLASADEPRRVEFFTAQQMHVVDVVCGTWNTFAAVVEEENALSNKEGQGTLDDQEV